MREAKKMTQNALANAAGVSPTYIYQLERGEKSPTVEYLDHICWGLGLTLKEFFDYPNEEENYTFRLASLSPPYPQLRHAFVKTL